MMMHKLAAIALFSIGSAAFAEPQVYRLSPAQVEAAKAAAALRPESPSPALLPPTQLPPALLASPDRDNILGSSLYGGDRPDTKIHGEVGMFIGTGGARGLYGTTAVPLGENGMAQFSFSTSQFGDQYRVRR